MEQGKMLQIASSYAARGPMTTVEFLAKHQISERQLRAAVRHSKESGLSEKQTVLPFVKEVSAPTKDERIKLLEKENHRLRSALRVAMLTIESSRNKADTSLHLIRQSLEG